MALGVLAVAQRLLPYDAAWPFAVRVVWVVGVAALGAGLFVGTAVALQAPEVGETFGALRRRKAT